MAVSLVSVRTGTSSGSPTCTEPASAADGDLLVAVVTYFAQGVTATLSGSGWSLVALVDSSTAPISSNTSGVMIFKKVRSGATGTTTCTFSASVDFGIAGFSIYAFRGAADVTPYSVLSTGANATMTVPSVTVGSAGSYLVMGAHTYGTPTTATTTGITWTGSTQADISYSKTWSAPAGAGATGTTSIAGGTANGNTVILGVVTPASTGNSGTAAGAQSGLTASAAGTLALSGTAAGVRPGLTASASGTLAIVGAAAGAQLGLVTAAAGALALSGSAAGVQPGLVAAASGDAVNALGPFVRLRADHASSFGGNTTSISDMVLAGHTVSQATPLNQPAAPATDSAVNSQLGIVCTDDTKLNSSLATSEWEFLRDGSPFEVVLIVKPVVDGDIHAFVGTTGSSTTGYVAFVDASGYFIGTPLLGGIPQASTSIGPATTGVPVVFDQSSDASASPDYTQRMTGAAQSTGNYGTLPSGPSDSTLFIGAGQGSFYELLIFKRQLSDAERSTIAAYTLSYYGLTLPTANQGSAAGVQSGLVGAAGGTLALSGSAAGVQPGLTAIAAGAGVATGSVAGLQPGLTAAAVGALSLSGAGAGAQSGLTAAAAGSLRIVGAASGLQAGLTASAAGASGIAGAAAGAQSGLTGSASGSLALSGAAAGAQAGLTASGAGALALQGSAAGVQAGLVAAAAQSTTISGGAAGVQPGLTASAAGTAALVGAIAGAQSGLVAAAVGNQPNTGTAAGVQSGLSGSAAGTLALSGAAAGAQPGLVALAGGGSAQVGAAAGVQAGLVGSAVGALALVGSASGVQAGLVAAAVSPMSGRITAVMPGLSGGASDGSLPMRKLGAIAGSARSGRGRGRR